MAPQQFASADKVVDRLADVSRIIRLRMDLKPVEKTRVIEAFKLTAQHQVARLKSKQVVYRDFLRRVNTTVGPYGVVICAAALGISAVVSMKDRMRVEIPTRMKEREKELSHNTVRHMASKFASNALGEQRTLPIVATKTGLRRDS
ncbi:hypothetical protein Purlil1_13988 [Purpureocillium lilacinum]|uniref:Uncharacterized protein n=1 Tax=Purpureocillium lilacinum TaxID=33203 RepID=A0ABR0BCI2_PURLI|nr:hypothetical protein Purlil1_13988 [Purpureocillium lilacinum]